MKIAELMALAHDPSPSARARLVDGVGAFMFGDPDATSERERELAIDIVRRLIEEAEVAVRRALAERLAHEPRAPRDLVLALANDVIGVARPILVECEMLADGDLIEIIHQRTLQHQLAIAMRQQVSETVSAALVSTANPEVMRVLVENPNARIGRRTYDRLVEHSRSVEALQAPLIRRHDLDPELASRMYTWVSAALRREIVAHFDIDPKLLDESLADSLKAAIGEHQGHAGPTQALSQSGIHADDSGLLLKLLRAGEIAAFEGLLARKTGLRLLIARRVFYEPGGRPLAVACKAIGIEKPQFAAIFLLARQARPGDKSVDPTELQTILAYFDSLTVVSARQEIEAWRRGSNSPGARTRA